MDYQNRYRPTERGGQFGAAGAIRRDAAAILDSIDVDLNNLLSCVQSIGAPFDSPKNHSELTRLRGVIMDNVKAADQDIKSKQAGAVGPEKIRLSQLHKRLTEQITKFNTALENAQVAQRQDIAQNGPPPPYQFQPPQSQTQAQVSSNALEIRQQELREISELETDIIGLREIHQDLANMVEEQGETIEQITNNVTVAQTRTEAATNNLGKAVELKRANRKLICIIVTILVIIGLIMLVALVIGLAVGLSYANKAVPAIPTILPGSTTATTSPPSG